MSISVDDVKCVSLFNNFNTSRRPLLDAPPGWLRNGSLIWRRYWFRCTYGSWKSSLIKVCVLNFSSRGTQPIWLLSNGRGPELQKKLETVFSLALDFIAFVWALGNKIPKKFKRTALIMISSVRKTCHYICSFDVSVMRVRVIKCKKWGRQGQVKLSL